MSSRLKLILSLYLLALLVLSFFIIPTTDAYYYWTWSRSLQLSYLDGPPMIAYAIWLTTHLLGDNLFAIDSLSFIQIVGTAWLIYRIVCLIDNQKSAYIATAIWLVYPFATTRFIAISMTLDGFEVFFSMLILLITCKLIKDPRAKYIYQLGVAVGFGLLAKYNVIIFVVGLMLFFALNKPLRGIFRSPHLYLSAIMCLLIFSPVIFWNYQHDWISFKYQMYSHEWNGASGAINSAEKHGVFGMWFYFKSCVLGVLHIIILALLFMKLKFKAKLNDSLPNKLILFSVSFILLFWLYKSYSAHVGLNYMVTASALLIIILSQMLSPIKSQNYLLVVVILMVIISVVMEVNRSLVHSKDQANYEKYISSGLIKRVF